MALMDLPLERGSYHFLISTDWEELFPDATRSYFARPASDHVSLVMDGGFCLRPESVSF